MSEEYSGGIKDWPEDDRPREKLFKYGEHTLSDSELLAIILRTGKKGQSALDLSRKILEKFGNFRNMSHTNISQWREFKGVGPAKLTQIRAAIEIGRRFLSQDKGKKPRVSCSREVVDLLMPRMRDLKKELFQVLLLNSRNTILEIAEIDEGGVNQARPQVREIMNRAFQNFAASLIAVHNHPSGDPAPSEEDKEFTRRLVQAGLLMELKVLDHIIIGDNRYFSFADEGLMEKFNSQSK